MAIDAAAKGAKGLVKSKLGRRLQSAGPTVRVKLCKRKTGLWCSIGWHSNYDKSYARCCQYQNRRRTQHVVQPRVRVKICKRKTGLWCSIGWHTNRDKSYARCCQYQNRRNQAVQKSYKCPVDVEGMQCFL